MAAKEIAQTHTRGSGAKHTRGSGVAMTNAQVLRLQLSNLGVPPSWYKTSGRDAMASCAVAIGARGQFFTAGPERVRISFKRRPRRGVDRGRGAGWAPDRVIL